MMLLGVGLAIAGLFLITLRPRSNPLIGRVLIVLGALILAVVLWQSVQQPPFRPDR
jgi:uncharacterized membrane protein